MSLNKIRPEDAQSEEDKLAKVIEALEQRSGADAQLVPLLMEVKRSPGVMGELDLALNANDTAWSYFKTLEGEEITRVISALEGLLKTNSSQNDSGVKIAAKKVAESLRGGISQAA